MSTKPFFPLRLETIRDLAIAVQELAKRFNALAADEDKLTSTVAATAASPAGTTATADVSSTAHGLAPQSPGDPTKFLNGDFAPSYAAVKGSDLSMSDVTTNDVSSAKHGFAPKSPGDATKFLSGAVIPAYAAVTDIDLSTSDVLDNNVSTAKHGFAPKGTGTGTKFLDDTGAYSTPAGVGGYPPALPVFPTISNLVGRFSAEPTISALTLNTDGRCSVLSDASGAWGSNFIAAGTARPRWMKRAMSSMRPGLVFDGSATIMQTTASKIVAQPLTIVIVVQNWKNGVSNENLYRDTNSGPVTFISGGNTWAIFAGSTLSSATLFSQNRDVMPDGVIAAPAIIMNVFNGATSIIGNNGVEVAGAAGATGISGQMSLGSGAPGSGSFAHMVFYEILFFSKALSLAERGQINTYYSTALDIQL